MMCDLDFFKHINDHYGHAVGDRVLIAVAGVFTEQLRRIDIIGRLGGEEFGILLPGVTLDEATVAADRLRQAVAGLSIPGGGKTVSCTISIGLAEWSPAESLDSLLGRADKALYEAKERGRDRVVVDTT